MKYVKVKDLMIPDIPKEKVEEIASKFEEIKALKIVENRLRWEELRERVFEIIRQGGKPYFYKIANEILQAYDKSLRETEKISINVNLNSNRVFLIKVKDEGEKKLIVREDGVKIEEGEIEGEGGDKDG